MSDPADGDDGAGPPDDAAADDGPPRADEDGGPSPSRDSETAGTPTSGEFPCPECGETLAAESRFCPHCGTPLDEDGAAVELSELDGRFSEDGSDFLRVEGGERRASGTVMVIAGLAVAIPLAPLGLFLVSTMTSLSIYTAPLVFLGSWLAPAAYFARARVPAEAFARSLYAIGIATAFVPVALWTGDSGLASGEFDLALESVAVVALLVAGLALGLGRYMHGQASGRVSGENRAFEDVREAMDDDRDES